MHILGLMPPVIRALGIIEYHPTAEREGTYKRLKLNGKLVGTRSFEIFASMTIIFHLIFETDLLPKHSAIDTSEHYSLQFNIQQLIVNPEICRNAIVPI